MNDNLASSKRVIKNTFLMYSRTFIMMFISLYTSRVILESLGVSDFGIYSIVAGFVAFFSIISSTLVNSTQRFITFELGKGVPESLQIVLSNSLSIHYLLGIVVLVLLETIGLWFVNYKLNIPLERLSAANFVFQFSVFSFFLNIISIPYSSLIIAYEKMNVLALIGILEALLKVFIALGISIYGNDKLILFSVLTFLASFIVRAIYMLYCRKKFHWIRFRLGWNNDKAWTMFNFASWNFIGSASGVLKDQGISIILNIMYGVTINAARGIVVQVESAVNQFVSSFTTSFNPQIVKSYASKDFEYMYKVVFNGGRFGFFLMLIIAYPIILNAELVLNLWLVKVPEYTVVFVQLSLIYSLILTISYPLITLNMATGKIKTYQLIVGSTHFLNFPISYVFLKVGYPAYIVYVIAIFLNVVCLFLRLLILRKSIGLSFRKYCYEVLFNVFLVTLVTVPLPLLISCFLPETIMYNILVLVLTFIISIMTVLFVGLNQLERQFLVDMLKMKLK